MYYAYINYTYSAYMHYVYINAFAVYMYINLILKKYLTHICTYINLKLKIHLTHMYVNIHTQDKYIHHFIFVFTVSFKIYNSYYISFIYYYN